MICPICEEVVMLPYEARRWGNCIKCAREEE